MALKISKVIDSIKKITKSEHDVERINSVERRYKALRQESKGPTFRTYLWWNIFCFNESMWILRRTG